MTTNLPPENDLPPDAPADGLHDVPAGSRWAKAHHVLILFLAAALVLWLLTGIFTVPVGEVAIVERLGTFVSNDKGKAILREPGQHFGLPWPIDIIHRVPFDSVRTMTVSEFYTPLPQYEETKQQFAMMPDPPSRVVLDAVFDPYLVTADKNILKAKATVQYKVSDPQAYIMAFAHGTETPDADAALEPLRQVISHALIREMARTPVDVALGEGRAELASQVQRGLAPKAATQPATGPAAADSEDAESHRIFQLLGVTVTNVTLEITWPANLDADFRHVTEARIGMETAKQNAETYKNSVITQAQIGDVAAISSSAAAYKQRVIEAAKGEADSFTRVFQRYQNAPELTRTSLYADAVSDIFRNVTRKIFVQPGERPTLVLDRPEEIPQRPAPPR